MRDVRTDIQPDTGVQKWLATARVAAIVVVVWSVVLQMTVGVLIPPVLAVGIVFAAVVPFLSRNRRWAGLTAAILGLASVGGNVPSLIEELSHPSSAQAFILTLFPATASVVLIVAGAASFLRSQANPAPVMWGAAGVVAVGSLVALMAAARVESVPIVSGDVAVVAKANQFSPDPLTATPGRLAVWIDNRDGARHTFTVPDLGIDVEIVGRKSQRVEFEASPGEYVVFCKVVGHDGMTATLVVR